ncbi:MAG: hypothetical protein ACRCU2_22325 [Planktothrix sp.]
MTLSLGFTPAIETLLDLGAVGESHLVGDRLVAVGRSPQTTGPLFSSLALANRSPQTTGPFFCFSLVLVD